MGFREDAYNLEEYPQAARFRILAAQVNESAGLNTWCFPSRRQTFYSTCLYEQEYYSLMKLGGCMDYVNSRPEGWDVPLIMSDPLGLTWLAEDVYYRDVRPAFLAIIGPMFLSSTSPQYIDQALRDRGVSVEELRQMTRILTGIPVISPTSLSRYARVMHYTLTGAHIDSSDIVFQNEPGKELPWNPASEPAFYDDPGQRFARERRLYSLVKNGNLKYKEIEDSSFIVNSDSLCKTGDPIRDAKNTLISLTVVCRMAALEGGLPANTAQELEARYIAEIEACRTYTKLQKVFDRMLSAFITGVHRNKEIPFVSKSIREACDYIRVNVLKSLTVDDIAKEMGYSTYYFTRKFNQEMGIKVTDYIKQVKIEYAKVALFSTGKSIQEISDELHFGSRSYFSKVFHSMAGMTPAAYRQKQGGISLDLTENEEKEAEDSGS